MNGGNNAASIKQIDYITILKKLRKSAKVANKKSKVTVIRKPVGRSLVTVS